MSGKKSAHKSARRARGKPFKAGKDPRRGRGPAKGAPNAGRPPNEFKEEMRKLASRDDTLRRLGELVTGKRRKVLKNGKTKVVVADVADDLFLKAFKEVADRGFGKAVQPLEHGGPDGGPIPVSSPAEVRDRIARELTGIASRRRAGTDPR